MSTQRAKASKLHCQNVLQHSFVQQQVRDQTLESIAFLFKLAKSSQLRGTKPPEFLLLAVEGGFAHPRLATDLWYGRSQFGLLQRKGDLLFGVFRSLHGMAPVPYSEIMPDFSNLDRY